MGGLSAKVGSSAKFCVLVFKASVLNYGGPSAKVGLSAKFGIAVFKASLLESPCGGPLAKVSSFAKFGGLVFKQISPVRVEIWGVFQGHFRHVLRVFWGV